VLAVALQQARQQRFATVIALRRPLFIARVILRYVVG
jgi:hypothetical protein